jgi:hypothetical protein
MFECVFDSSTALLFNPLLFLVPALSEKRISTFSVGGQASTIFPDFYPAALCK